MKIGVHPFFLCAVICTVFVDRSRADLDGIDGLKDTEDIVERVDIPSLKREDDLETFEEFLRNLDSEAKPIIRSGTRRPTLDELVESDSVLKNFIHGNADVDESSQKKIVIRTYWHRIQSEEDYGAKVEGENDRRMRALAVDEADVDIDAETMPGTDGFISPKTIKKQMAVLNKAFKKSGFIFKLAKTQDPIENSDWFYGWGAETNCTNSTNSTGFNFTGTNTTGCNETDYWYEMKEELREGGCSELNIYSVMTGDSGIGMSEFPIDCSDDLANDGVMIDWETVPGGALKPFNLGDTLVREVGHWLGLFNTFEGGCKKPGDFIQDTPAEESPASGCPKNRDTCPKSKGKDPVKNFMDFSDDKCVTHFTKGQGQRMKSQWETYRSCERHKTKKDCGADPSTCCKWKKAKCLGC